MALRNVTLSATVDSLLCGFCVFSLGISIYFDFDYKYFNYNSISIFSSISITISITINWIDLFRLIDISISITINWIINTVLQDPVAAVKTLTLFLFYEDSACIKS